MTKPVEKRKFLGILFECCSVYSRVYRSEEQMFYEGRCPKCLRHLKVRVDPHSGARERFWRAR